LNFRACEFNAEADHKKQAHRWIPHNFQRFLQLFRTNCLYSERYKLCFKIAQMWSWWWVNLFFSPFFFFFLLPGCDFGKAHCSSITGSFSFHHWALDAHNNCILYGWHIGLVCKQQGWDCVHSLLGMCTHLSLSLSIHNEIYLRFVIWKIMVFMASCARWLIWMSGKSKFKVHCSYVKIEWKNSTALNKP